MEDLLALAASPQAWAALATLVVMEVVLGIDNLIFISILTNKLPEHQRPGARRVGMGLAVILRLGLLASVAIIAQLTEPLFTLVGHGFSWRDLILIAGGLFLIWKATSEIHDNVAGEAEPEATPEGVAGMTMAGGRRPTLLPRPAFTAAGPAIIGVTHRVLPVVVLVLGLGRIERGCRQDLGHDGSHKFAGLLECCLRGFRQGAVLIVGDEDGRAVLPSLVAELSVRIE